ncbi:plasmid pRiA4b ORF-3 family protein [Erysipelotrichaceae bacterium OttesenSCG-928-M19]|nr:plasmid pRiA4b ORF-3 family protein [Erysipelotrichaceae bacterium OttesenSCG-928-M19]
MKAYQLKIMLKDASPPIWRRVIVPEGLTFTQLSIIINTVMNWSGYHLFDFEFKYQNLRIEEKSDDDEFSFGYEVLAANETYINEFIENNEWFSYTYDFGDDWQHRINVEKIVDNYDNNFAQVIKFKGGSPLEDSGHDLSYLDEYDIDYVNEELEDWYPVTLVDGDNRLQREIYMDAFENGDFGLIGKK